MNKKEKIEKIYEEYKQRCLDNDYEAIEEFINKCQEKINDEIYAFYDHISNLNDFVDELLEIIKSKEFYKKKSINNEVRTDEDDEEDDIYYLTMSNINECLDEMKENFYDNVVFFVCSGELEEMINKIEASFNDLRVDESL